MHLVDVGLELSAHVDNVPRDLVAAGFAGSLERWEQSRQHHHRKAQLLYTVRGIINCEVEDGIWIVPSFATTGTSGTTEGCASATEALGEGSTAAVALGDAPVDDAAGSLPRAASTSF